MLLQFFNLMSFPHDAIYVMKFTSPSHSRAPIQHDVAKTAIHTEDDVLRLVSVSISSTVMMVIMEKTQFNMSFIRLLDTSPKK